MKDQKKAQEIADRRLEIISPLLGFFDDPAKARQVRMQLVEQSGLSDRTLRRYLTNYKEHGYEGLKPCGRNHTRAEEAIPANILDQAITLRREVPTRSVAQIIQIMEWEKLIEPGQIKRSTLQEKLAHRGYSTRQMQMYADSGVAARRFQRRERMSLLHSDIKFGPFLPIGIKDKNGKNKLVQVYLVTFMDDATRFILHAEFYPTLDQKIVEDCFHKAVLKYGAPDSVYFDRGTQYRNKWMFRACGKLGVQLLYTKPYSPESSGKIERYHQEIDRFLAESWLEKPQDLDELNKQFWVWLEECYQNRSHSALKDKQSPAEAFNSSNKPLKFLEAAVIANAFLHSEKRKVDKAGCISFNSIKYEVGVLFIGCQVDVIYDPNDTSELTIECEGHEPIKAKPLVIGERTKPRPKLPEHLTSEPADHSRVLRAAEKLNQEREAKKAHAISYSQMKDGEENV
jgi:putative transposase